MTFNFMVYGMVMGAWLSAASYFLDRGLRAIGRPTRWIWAVGMVAVTCVPFLPRTGAGAASGNAPGSPISGELLYNLLTTGAQSCT